MADQLNNIQILDASAPYLTRGLQASDNLQSTANWEFQADVVIAANLTVTGDTFSSEAITQRYADNHLYLNDGYATVAAQTAGLVANYLPVALTDTIAATGFVAGVAATSNPVVTTVGSGTYSVGQLIQISGATNTQNNGLFEVLTHTGTALTIRGIGTTATVEDFTQNQFATDTTVTGTITQVTVSVLRAGTDGIWETASGSSTGLVFADLGSGGGNSLQQAYVAGNQITTSAGELDVIIAGTESLQITATGGLNLDAPFDFDSTSFDVQMTGVNGFSIDGTAASNVTATAGALTLSTVTSGSLILTSAGLVDINAAANLDIDVTGTYDMLATGVFSIDGTGASNVTTASGDLTVSSGSGSVVVDGGELAVDAVQITASNAAGGVDINAGTGGITADTTAGLSLDAGTASNFTVTTGALTLATVTSGDLTLSTTTAGDILLSGAAEIDLTAAGLIDVNAGANLDIDVTGTYDMLATGAFSIDGTGVSNVSATSGNLTLSTVTTGGILITSAGDSTYTVPDPSATAFALTDGTSTYINVDSQAGFEALDLDTHVNLIEGAGVDRTTTVILVAGDVVSVTQPTGNLQLADANTGTLIDALVFGVSRGSHGAASTAQIFSVPGSIVPVRFTAAPAAASNGGFVYLSATAGQATMAAPGGATVTQFVIGILLGGDGASTTPDVLFRPQFISRGPQVT